MAVDLSHEQKEKIVVALAMCRTPTEIRDMLQADFGIAVNLSTIAYYDASGANPDLAEKWRELFDATRERYFVMLARMPIVDKRWRLRQLMTLYEKEVAMSNFGAAKETLKQAAQEVGDAFTNRRELTGKGGGPMETSGVMLYLPDNGRDRA